MAVLISTDRNPQFQKGKPYTGKADSKKNQILWRQEETLVKDKPWPISFIFILEKLYQDNLTDRKFLCA